MQKIFSVLVLSCCSTCALAQQINTGDKGPPQAATPPQWWIWVVLGLVIALITYLFTRHRWGSIDGEVRGLGKPRSAGMSGSSRDNFPPNSRKTSASIAPATPQPEREAPPEAGVQKVPAPAPKVETPQPEEPALQEDRPIPAEATPGPQPPVPEVFYMTVPAADGSFPANTRKAQPTGCLYQFEVAPEKPTEAAVRFAGSEADMRNAQAFRDLELLPACTFTNLPQENRFRFEQKPGYAILENGLWLVKKKIEVRFV